jgi:1,4-alpha-glucan branching enzyme
VIEDGTERCLTWREAGEALADYAHHMGFTHLELMPVMEHEDDGAPGCAVTGWFAPTARYGEPEGLMVLVDQLHRRGVGVILAWAPAAPAEALARFDGSGLFGRAGPPGVFDLARPEVRSFLISSALFWLERFHADGLRVSGLGEILYPEPRHGDGDLRNGPDGGQDPHALRFVEGLNAAVHRQHPGALTIAEESTAWARVTRPVQEGGLGFDFKWNLNWMYDTLGYLAEDPIYRKHHHERLTASLWYAFSERFLLPLPHSLVSAGKGSLVARMPGDDWQKQATLRLLAGWLFAHPGRKLVFMGHEIGQWREWSPQRSLDWHLLDFPGHQGIQAWVRDLNHLYRRAPALFQQDFSEDGFAWVEANDAERSVVAFVRRGRSPDDLMLVVANFTPVVRHNYRLGVPRPGWWQEVLNGDARGYGGSGQGNLGGIEADPVGAHGQFQSLSLTLPPLAVIFLQYQGEGHAEVSRK